jgi:pimeloyl-ACP methyl ester carboxylesterase
MDMYGFGCSAKPEPASPQTIEQYAQGALALADALGLPQFTVVGHHTGAFVANELAASAPDRVRAVVLSAGEYADAAFRDASARKYAARNDGAPAAGVDVAIVRADGSHLTELWAKRAPLYPARRPDILDRFIRDALAPGVDPVEGHIACGRYVMEDRVGQVSAPVLLLANTGDPVSYPYKDRMSNAYPNAKTVEIVEIVGGTVAVMEQMPTDVVAAIEEFLDAMGL